jgi:hypothetical protein
MRIAYLVIKRILVLFTFLTEIELVKLLFTYLLNLLYIGNQVTFNKKLFVSHDQILF